MNETDAKRRWRWWCGYDRVAAPGGWFDLRAMDTARVLGQGVVTRNTFRRSSIFSGGVVARRGRFFGQLELLVGRAQFGGGEDRVDPLRSISGSVAQAVGALGVEVPLVWDPILSASAGFELHRSGWGDRSAESGWSR